MPQRALQSKFIGGYKLQTVPGTPATIAAADCVGYVQMEPIQPKVDSTAVTGGGLIGAEQYAPGRYWGEIADMTENIVPLYSRWKDTVKCSNATFLTNIFAIGGNAYSAITGTDAGRINNQIMTFAQWDGVMRYQISDAVPTKMSIEAKNGQPIELKSSWIGRYTETSAAPIVPIAPPSAAPIVAVNSVITLDSYTLEWSEVSVDLGVKTVTLKNAGVADGIAGFEVIDADPTITIDPYTMSTSAYDIYTKLRAQTSTNFSWTLPSGIAITAKCAINQSESSWDEGVGRKKIVLKPIYDSTTGYVVRITGV